MAARSLRVAGQQVVSTYDSISCTPPQLWRNGEDGFYTPRRNLSANHKLAKEMDSIAACNPTASQVADLIKMQVRSHVSGARLANAVHGVAGHDDHGGRPQRLQGSREAQGAVGADA